MVAPTSVVQRLVILHNFFDALCLMRQSLHPTVAEKLTLPAAARRGRIVVVCGRIVY